MRHLLMFLMMFGLAGSAFSASLNEIRLEQSGADNDEFFEIAGTSGESLNTLTLIVLGDGTGGSGVIENVTSLAGLTVPADGFFFAAESTFTGSATPDLVASLNFEGSDNVTYLLVDGFTGADGDDLDTNDDGVLDVTPWTAIVSEVAVIEEPNPPASTEFAYSSITVGPDGSFLPGHVFVLPDGSTSWNIGSFSDLSQDTPGVTNVIPAATLEGAAAFNGDLIADFDIDPGAVGAGDFTLTVNGAAANVTGVSGSGDRRVLTTDATFADQDTSTDTLTVAATSTTNAGAVDFFALPPISLIQQGDIAAGSLVGVRATVTAKNNGSGSGPEDYAIASAPGAWNGVLVDDGTNAPLEGDVVELVGETKENFGVTQIANVTDFQLVGPGQKIGATLIPPSDFQAGNASNALPAEQWEGVLVRVNQVLTNAADGSFGETDFDEGVHLDDVFFDSRGEGIVVDGNNYRVTGIGYFSFGEYKILPRGAADTSFAGGGGLDFANPTIVLEGSSTQIRTAMGAAAGTTIGAFDPRSLGLQPNGNLVVQQDNGATNSQGFFSLDVSGTGVTATLPVPLAALTAALDTVAVSDNANRIAGDGTWFISEFDNVDEILSVVSPGGANTVTNLTTPEIDGIVGIELNQTQTAVIVVQTGGFGAPNESIWSIPTGGGAATEIVTAADMAAFLGADPTDLGLSGTVRLDPSDGSLLTFAEKGFGTAAAGQTLEDTLVRFTEAGAISAAVTEAEFDAFSGEPAGTGAGPATFTADSQGNLYIFEEFGVPNDQIIIKRKSDGQFFRVLYSDIEAAVGTDTVDEFEDVALVENGGNVTLFAVHDDNGATASAKIISITFGPAAPLPPNAATDWGVFE